MSEHNSGQERPAAEAPVQRPDRLAWPVLPEIPTQQPPEVHVEARRRKLHGLRTRLEQIYDQRFGAPQGRHTRGGGEQAPEGAASAPEVAPLGAVPLPWEHGPRPPEPDRERGRMAAMEERWERREVTPIIQPTPGSLPLGEQLREALPDDGDRKRWAEKGKQASAKVAHGVNRGLYGERVATAIDRRLQAERAAREADEGVPLGPPELGTPLDPGEAARQAREVQAIAEAEGMGGIIGAGRAARELVGAAREAYGEGRRRRREKREVKRARKEALKAAAGSPPPPIGPPPPWDPPIGPPPPGDPGGPRGPERPLSAYERLSPAAKREVDERMKTIKDMAKSHHEVERSRGAQNVVMGLTLDEDDFQEAVEAMHERLGLEEKWASSSKVKAGTREVWRSAGLVDGEKGLARQIAVYETHSRAGGIRPRRGPATRFVVVVTPEEAFEPRKTGIRPSHPAFVPGLSAKKEQELSGLSALRYASGGLTPSMTAASENAMDVATREYLRKHPGERPLDPDPAGFTPQDLTPPSRPEARPDEDPVGEAAQRLLGMLRQAEGMPGYRLTRLPYAVTDGVRRGQALRYIARLAEQESVLWRDKGGRLHPVSLPGQPGIDHPDALLLFRALSGEEDS